MLASMAGHINVVKLFYFAGANIDAKVKVSIMTYLRINDLTLYYNLFAVA
jgi:hypothetical protein